MLGGWHPGQPSCLGSNVNGSGDHMLGVLCAAGAWTGPCGCQGVQAGLLAATGDADDEPEATGHRPRIDAAARQGAEYERQVQPAVML